MNNNVNYTMVGFSALLGFFLMFGFGYWLLKPSSQNKTKLYLIYFNESVLGLNVDAPVKYRGVTVGKVSKIRINQKNVKQVEVLIKVTKDTPIKTNTVAKLTSQGITGLSYINLSLSSFTGALIESDDNEDGDYPIIKTEPSFFERFEKSFDTVSGKVSKTLTKTEQLLNDENQKQFALILKRAARFMDKMEKIVDEKNQKNIAVILEKSAGFMSKAEQLVDKPTIKHFHSTMANVDKASAKFDDVLRDADIFIDKSVAWEEKIQKSFASIMNSYLGIQSSMAEIKRAVSSGEFNFKEISSDIVPTMNSTFLQFQELMIKLEVAIEQYERSPRDILFKSEQIKKGPGEE